MRQAAPIALLLAMLATIAGGVWWILTTISADAPRVDEPSQRVETAAPTIKLDRGAGLVRDELHAWETAEAFNRGHMERAEVADNGGGSSVILADGRPDEFRRTGAWTSPPIEPGFAFAELLPSWNVITPPDTGIRVDGRVRIDGQWSPWLDFGYWGRVPPPDALERFEHGEVAVDILELSRPADAYQLRATFYSISLADSDDTRPSLRRLAAVASGYSSVPIADGSIAWAGDHAVPFIPQRSAGERIGGEICSPTCVTMVAAFHGADRPLVENALAIYDNEHAIFGNWNRAAARAGELGLAARAERFSSLDQARALLRDGLPLIISVRYNAGEAPSFLMERTGGHLIVLRGVTAEGDFVVNDPADAERGEAAVYTAEDVRKAWLGNASGVGYVLKPAPP